MKDKKWYKIWWVWLVVIVTIALIVFVPIVINESYKMNSGYITLWGAEDVLSYAATIMSAIGSLILSIVAVRLNKNANEISKMAFKQSEDLFEMQKIEYVPFLNVQSFWGLSKYKMEKVPNAKFSDFVMFASRTEENDVELGYMLNLNYSPQNSQFIRTYEINFQYLGKNTVESIVLNSIKFKSDKFEKKFDVGKKIDISLYDKQKFKLIFNVFSDKDFVTNGTEANDIIKAIRLEINFGMLTLTDMQYEGNVTITKYFLEEAERQLNTPNIEVMVSAQYEVKEILPK